MTTAKDATLLEKIKKDIQALDNLIGKVTTAGAQAQTTPSIAADIQNNCKDVKRKILGITTPSQTRNNDAFANFSISFGQVLKGIQVLKIEEQRKDQKTGNQTEEDSVSAKQESPSPAAKQIGTMITTNNKNDSQNENYNNYNWKRRAERPQQRNFQRRGSTRISSPRFRRKRFARYRETDDDEYSSDEEHTSRKRIRNVFDRLGDKKEDAEISTPKKV